MLLSYLKRKHFYLPPTWKTATSKFKGSETTPHNKLAMQKCPVENFKLLSL